MADAITFVTDAGEELLARTTTRERRSVVGAPPDESLLTAGALSLTRESLARRTRTGVALKDADVRATKIVVARVSTAIKRLPAGLPASVRNQVRITGRVFPPGTETRVN